MECKYHPFKEKRGLTEGNRISAQTCKDHATFYYTIKKKITNNNTIFCLLTYNNITFYYPSIINNTNLFVFP